MMKKFIFISLLALVSSVNLRADSEGESAVEPAEESFDRGIGISKVVFVPKGTLNMGINFSYNTMDLGKADEDNGYSMLFDLMNGIKGNMYTFGLSPQFSYFLLDNFSVGWRFKYDRSSIELGNASLSLDESLGFNIKDYNMLEHMFSGSATARYYMSIADSKRFAIFAEGRATGAFGQSKMWKVEDGGKYGSYQKIFKGAITFVPGICIFAQDNTAVEVAIGVLGINYTRKEQIRNQVEHSVMQTSGANFRINPLSIEIGLSFYLYPKDLKKLAGKGKAKRTKKVKEEQQ